MANEDDYVLLDISAAGGRFAGATELYGDQCTQELAIGLRGFPRSTDDRRVIVLGSADERIAGGWVEITCQCLDRAGHAMLQIKTMDKYRVHGLDERIVRVHLPVEASAIDVFVGQLLKWDHASGSSVSLPGAT